MLESPSLGFFLLANGQQGEDLKWNRLWESKSAEGRHAMDTQYHRSFGAGRSVSAFRVPSFPHLLFSWCSSLFCCWSGFCPFWWLSCPLVSECVPAIPLLNTDSQWPAHGHHHVWLSGWYPCPHWPRSRTRSRTHVQWLLFNSHLFCTSSSLSSINVYFFLSWKG